MEKLASSTAAATLRAAKRIVVKVGSAILCGDDGSVRSTWLASLADDLAGLRAKGCEVVVVTSGAIAIGRRRLGLSGSLQLDEKQAASAAGQVALAQAWQGAFERYDIQIGQVLLTLADTEDRRRYLNARATFRTLLNLNVLPLVNENDTVATSEIRYGDNDRLAAHAAQIVESDVLIILSDVDGLYSADPRSDLDAVHIAVVEAITPKIENIASGPNKNAGVGAGGMASKIAAAKIAGANGCATIIAPGGEANPVAAVAEGGRSTLICATGNPERARRQWIGGRIKPAGVIEVDAGAVKALKAGASLLPAGVVKVEGLFSRGDAVTIMSPGREPLGQGLSAYSSSEIEKIAGRRSDELENLLGYRRRPAVVEKNDLVLRTE